MGFGLMLEMCKVSSFLSDFVLIFNSSSLGLDTEPEMSDEDEAELKKSFAMADANSDGGVTYAGMVYAISENSKCYYIVI